MLASDPLDFLIKTGLHHETVTSYLEHSHESSMTEGLIYQASSRYVATYARSYGQHYLGKNNRYRHQVQEHLCKVLVPSNRDISNDLHVLVSLPRAALVSGSGTQDAEQGVIAALIRLPHSAEVYDAIGIIVSGESGRLAPNPDDEATGQDNSQFERVDPEAEAAAARTIYLTITSDPSFWERVVTSAETLSLDAKALAAIGLIRAVTTASWPLSDQNMTIHTRSLPSRLAPAMSRHSYDHTHGSARAPSPSDSARQTSARTLLSGAESLVSTPVAPYLLSPYTRYNPARNDSDSAEYGIGMAKHEVLRTWVGELRKGKGRWERSGEVSAQEDGDVNHTGLVRTGEMRIRQGPFARGVDGGGLQAC